LIYHNKIPNIYLALHQLEASAVSDTFNKLLFYYS
jgi:hypothetical protein